MTSPTRDLTGATSWPLVVLVLATASVGCGDAPNVPPDGPDGTDGPVDAPAADATIDDALLDAAVDAPAPELPARIRVVAAGLASGGTRQYQPPGARILQGLDADVALLQEFNVGTNSVAELRAFVDQAFGPEFGFIRQPDVALPTAVVSRYPIMMSGVWSDSHTTDRDFTWARLDVPGPRDLWAVSVHLVTTSSGERDAEAGELVGAISLAVPATDFLVIGGNLNTALRDEAAVMELAPTVGTTGPYPADQNGNGNTNATRNRPLDWVLADADLRSYQAPVAIGASTYPAGLVFDSRVYTPLVDVAPVVTTDSGAAGMAHMAVVEDFVVTQ